MKKSKFSEEQIAYALRQADGGTPVGDVCWQLGVSEATFYVWKKKYGTLGLSELREIRQLRDENARLTDPARIRPARSAKADRRRQRFLVVNCLKTGPSAGAYGTTRGHGAQLTVA